MPLIKYKRLKLSSLIYPKIAKSLNRDSFFVGKKSLFTKNIPEPIPVRKQPEPEKFTESDREQEKIEPKAPKLEEREEPEVPQEYFRVIPTRRGIGAGEPTEFVETPREAKEERSKIGTRPDIKPLEREDSARKDVVPNTERPTLNVPDLPSDEEIKEANFVSAGEWEGTKLKTRHNKNIGYLEAKGNRYFFKGMFNAEYEGKTTSLNNEVLASNLLKLLGVASPNARAVVLDQVSKRQGKGRGLLTNWIDGIDLASLTTEGREQTSELSGAQFQELEASLFPGEVDKNILAAFYIGNDDAHIGNHIFHQGHLVLIDNENGFDWEPIERSQHLIYQDHSGLLALRALRPEQRFIDVFKGNPDNLSRIRETVDIMNQVSLDPRSVIEIANTIAKTEEAASEYLGEGKSMKALRARGLCITRLAELAQPKIIDLINLIEGPQ